MQLSAGVSRLLVLVYLPLLLAFVLAQAPLALDLRPYRVLVQGGQERLEENPLGVRPGDVLEWRLQAENRGQSPLNRVVLVIPIPKETFYLEATARPLEHRGQRILPEFSFDGGRTFGLPPLKRKVRVVEGGREVEKEVVVDPKEYTHARWTLPVLGPGEKVLVSLRTQVR